MAKIEEIKKWLKGIYNEEIWSWTITWKEDEKTITYNWGGINNWKIYSLSV